MFYPLALGQLAQARVSRSRLASLLANSQAKGREAAALEAKASGELICPPGQIVVQGGEFWWAEPKVGGTDKSAPVAAAPAAKKKPPLWKKTAKTAKMAPTATRTVLEANQPASDREVAAHRATLSGVSLTVRPGELIAVVGQTGVGKTSLCAAILQEMVQVDGRPVLAGGSVAYAAQSPWVLNATVKDNILFGASCDVERYERICDMCQLLPDFEQLPDGDRTEIGERGITLSGGQKQRVAIARAAYAAADICILDDVLSALDPEVASQVFERCIVHHLAQTTRLLVTNRVDLSPRCDRVIMLLQSDDGVARIGEIGTHAELMQNAGAYADLFDEVSSKFTDEHAHPSKAGSTAAAVEASAGAAASQAAAAAAGPEAASSNGGAAKPEASKLMQKEDRREGAVRGQVYTKYIKAGGGWVVVSLTLVLHVFATMTMTGSTLWLGFWAADASPTPMVLANGTVMPPGTAYGVLPFSVYVSGYAAIGAIVGVATFIRTIGMALFSLRAARKMHDQLVARVMHAPLAFFDTTPIGRIVSRFSKDIYSIDRDLLENADFFLFMSAMLLATMVVIIAATPWFAVAMMPILIIYLRYVHAYRQVCCREAHTRLAAGPRTRLTAGPRTRLTAAPSPLAAAAPSPLAAAAPNPLAAAAPNPSGPPPHPRLPAGVA